MEKQREGRESVPNQEPENPVTAATECEPVSRPDPYGKAPFREVIHGPMSAAPLWQARIGRWIT